MKIKIIYQNDGGLKLGCWATTILPNGSYFSSCGDTYADAKQRLLEKIKIKRPAIPPTEEVEVREPDEPS